MPVVTNHPKFTNYQLLFCHVCFIFLFFFIVYLLTFGCIRSSLQRAGSLVAARGAPRSMWDLSSQTRDETCLPCIGRWILNHWTTREVPALTF